jgi:hypothetical protein
VTAESVPFGLSASLWAPLFEPPLAQIGERQGAVLGEGVDPLALAIGPPFKLGREELCLCLVAGRQADRSACSRLALESGIPNATFFIAKLLACPLSD